MSRYDEELGRRVHDELTDRAASVRGTPLALTDVKTRATRIRRRRTATAALAAAAVLAVVVPTGLAATDAFDRSGQPPVAQTPPPVPSPAPSPGPSRLSEGRTLLTIDAPPSQFPAAIPVLLDERVSLPSGGEAVDVPSGSDGFGAFGAGWFVTGSDEDANRFVAFLDSSGAVVESVPLSGSGVAVSEDHSVVAYATADERLVVRNAEGVEVEIATPAEAGSLQPVDVIASGGRCSDPGTDPDSTGCAVLANEDGDVPQAWSLDAGGNQERLPMARGSDRQANRFAGYAQLNEDTSVCSGVFQQIDRPVWDSCDYALGRFNHDGRYLIGWPAQGSGAGSSSLAIVDAWTGEALATYASDETTQAFIFDATWESETELLATVFERGDWALMRLSVDGSLEKVRDLEGGDEVSPSLYLPLSD